MVERLVSRRKADWERLEKLLARTRAKRIGALSAEEIVELGYLYRRTAADLAIARRDFPGDRACLYLNQLVARAHAVVYRSQEGEWRGIVDFLRRGFPALFRETLPFTGVAFFIFIVAGLAGFFAAMLEPDSAGYLVPDSVAAAVRDKRMWMDDMNAPAPLMASFVMRNNIQVVLLSFAGGVAFGAVTFYVIAFNGLTLGAVAGFCQAYGLSLPLWSFVAPHGVIELTVIFIAGGSGLRLGYALLHPGLYRRLESLLLSARQVVKLLFGCVPLLVIAGTIEGFISPSALPPLVKVAIGVTSGVLLYGYLLLSGRTPAR